MLKKAKGLEQFNKIEKGSGPAGYGMTEEKDHATYMRSKREKFGAADGAHDIEKQRSSERQKKARDIAMSLNPFEGTGTNTNAVTGFMNYVEDEQDYYQRGQTNHQALALSREKARSAIKRSAAEARTSEMLGPDAIHTIRDGRSSKFDKNKLMINKFDMNSFTLSNGVRAVGSIMIFRDTFYLWDVASAEEVTLEKMTPITHMFPVPKFVVFGTGVTHEIIHPDIHMYLRQRGTRLDTMSTEKAVSVHHQCRIDDYPFATILLPMEPTNGFDYFQYNKYWKQMKEVSHGLGGVGTNK
eukprot:TRINITY_DN1024_c1_g1_i3.p1 TRINITY_DN1024_c1_g1~~TRINITY_DN1024_c1_g1_i3.p1  ORF type:complete len:298 (+),score=59.64 TRINITY_DN1024_c1_g1_i3:137-1030(+)